MKGGKAVQISASILGADMACLAQEVEAADEAGADRFHIDVMDGHFAPNLSMGPWLVECLRPHTSKPFDVQLMITNPLDHVKSFLDAGANLVFVHAEADRSEEALAKLPPDARGLAVNPETELPKACPVGSVLIMTVNPGFCGQEFMKNQLGKISDAKAAGFLVQVDGGVNPTSAPLAIKAGADILVAGSAIYGGHGDYSEKILRIRENEGSNICSL